jgi:chromosomal replication initiator protein
LNKKVKAIYNGQMVHIDYSPFWDETLRQVENDFIENGKESEFRIWFNILYVDSKDNKITASVPSQYIHDQMFRRGYIDIIQNKLVEISGQDLEV